MTTGAFSNPLQFEFESGYIDTVHAGLEDYQSTVTEFDAMSPVTDCSRTTEEVCDVWTIYG